MSKSARPRIPSLAEDREQSARFVKAAREHEASEDRAAFESAFAEIVPPKVGKPNPKSKKPSR
jgi:hypothetical protein